MTGADKSFATLRARAALQGITVLRTDPADGPVRLFLERTGIFPQWRQVRSIDDLEVLIAQLAPVQVPA